MIKLREGGGKKKKGGGEGFVKEGSREPFRGARCFLERRLCQPRVVHYDVYSSSMLDIVRSSAFQPLQTIFPPPPPVYSLQPRGWRSLARGWNVDTCRVSCTSKFDRFKRVQKDDLIFKVAKIVSIKYMYRRRIKNSLL